MEETEESIICKKPSCISSTNWNVSDGSLDDSISFETPISSIYDEQEDFQDSKSLKKQLLVLNFSSSESSPCEIKLSFEQSHEIRQVYVRSTARIFEIYYATGPESSNEYLCTVRCGVTTKEDIPLGTSDTEEVMAHLEESTCQKDLHEERVKSDSSSNTDEDGWVDVKVPGSTLSNSKTCGAAKSSGGSVQDFYEATAEISDSSPCISVTLRLLSLHTKGCVHLEEIYIFAEPVEPTDSDDKVDPLKRSADGSMMAMFVPTLFQLSRAGMLNRDRDRDKHIPDVREETKRGDCESLGPCTGRAMQEEVQSSLPNREKTNVNADESRDPYMGRTVQEEAQSSLPVGGKADVESASKESPELTQQPDYPTPEGPESFNNLNDSSSGRLERALDQLLCRVGRIESFCSRFEENMLKPISNIETRLERVEQQLAVLMMRSQPPELYPCTRIIAPDFSCIESETNSLQNDVNEGNCCGTSDFASKGIKLVRPPEGFCDETGSCSSLDVTEEPCRGEPQSFLNDNASYSWVAPQLNPGLKITAPEFSMDNNDEDSHGGVGSGDDKGCSDDSASSKVGCSVTRPSLSLDDALAMALAGFMSNAGFMSTAAQPPSTNHSCIVDAHDSPDEKNGGNDSLDFPARSTNQKHADSTEIHETQNPENLASSSSCSPQGKVHIMRLPSDDSTQAVIRDCVLEEGTYGICGDQSVNWNIDGNSDKVREEVNNYTMNDTTDGLATPRTRQVNLVQVMKLPCDSSTEAVIRGCLLQEEGTVESCDAESVNQTITVNIDGIAWESSNYRMEDTGNGTPTDLNLSLNDDDVQEPSVANPGNKEEVDTVLDRSLSSTVDFEHPVLDVKFTASENLNTRGSLESLLSDAPETKVEDSCAEDKGSVASSTTGQLSLETGLQDRAVDHLLVEIDNVDGDTEARNGESKTKSSFDCGDMETVLWNLL